MGIDFTAILAYAFGLILLYIIAKALILPLRVLLKLLYNAIIGGIILIFLNAAGGYIGVNIAVNPVTTLVVGFLGVPGIIMLLILKYIIGMG